MISITSLLGEREFWLWVALYLCVQHLVAGVISEVIFRFWLRSEPTIQDFADAGCAFASEGGEK